MVNEVGLGLHLMVKGQYKTYFALTYSPTDSKSIKTLISNAHVFPEYLTQLYNKRLY